MVTEQLKFGFVAEMDFAIAERADAERVRMQRANDIAILRAHVQQYPMTDYEHGVIPKGIRLSRFVIDSECRECPYATEDHSLGEMFGLDESVAGRTSVPLVCLKDWHRKIGRLLE